MFAQQGKGYETFARRFHSISISLATSDRGSDSVKLWNNMLQITSLSRTYIADLERVSAAILSVNAEFRNYSENLISWSFYKTQKLKLGPISTFIIDPDSATLGHCEEERMPVNVDHHSIYKFETEMDQNSATIRNALASTTHQIRDPRYVDKLILNEFRSQCTRSYTDREI